MRHINYKKLLASVILSILLPVGLFGQSKRPAGKVEPVIWDGDCVVLDDFKLIELDSTDVVTDYTRISEKMKLPSRMRLINDTVIAYSENKEFNLFRIANLRTQEVIELLPVIIDGGKGHLSSIGQILWADDQIWLIDWKDNRVGALKYDYSNKFNSMQLWVLPEVYRIVPQKGDKLASMPGFTEDVRVEILDIVTGESSILSKKFPPVNRKGSLCNLEVQADMDVAPDMSYFVIATLGWDFIEIYKDGEIKMIRGPFFNETRYVPQKNMKPYMMANEHKSFSSLRVGNDKFAVGIADEHLDESHNRVLVDIHTILVFSNDGKPLYRISLPNSIYEFDIDYANNELITLEDEDHPKLKKYKIKF